VSGRLLLLPVQTMIAERWELQSAQEVVKVPRQLVQTPREEWVPRRVLLLPRT
jgi:hypothetical protein